MKSIIDTKRTRFATGQVLASRSACNSECIYTGVIVSITEKTVLISVDGELKRCKIHRDNNIFDGVEFIYPFGRYSMAAIFRANRELNQTEVLNHG